jgi:integrase
MARAVEVRGLLDEAGDDRALLATMVLGGLRVSELCALRLADVDLASAKLRVSDSKTDVELAKQGRAPTKGVTNHSLRCTFASLLYKAGATLAYLMGQMGHTDPALALAVCTKVMERKRDTGERMDALVRGSDSAATGSKPAEAVDPVSVVATENPPFPAGF